MTSTRRSSTQNLRSAMTSSEKIRNAVSREGRYSLIGRGSGSDQDRHTARERTRFEDTTARRGPGSRMFSSIGEARIAEHSLLFRQQQGLIHKYNRASPNVPTGDQFLLGPFPDPCFKEKNYITVLLGQASAQQLFCSITLGRPSCTKATPPKERISLERRKFLSDSPGEQGKHRS